jgi:hypothetical protein
MTIRASNSIACIAWTLGACGLAQASSCYEIVDASNAVVYQSPIPPRALSVDGPKDFQDQLRRRGHHMRWYETYYCPDRSAISAYGSKKNEAPGTFEPEIFLRNTAPFGASAIGGSRR